jgi:hypothetical protein
VIERIQLEWDERDKIAVAALLCGRNGPTFDAETAPPHRLATMRAPRQGRMSANSRLTTTSLDSREDGCIHGSIQRTTVRPNGDFYATNETLADSEGRKDKIPFD